MLTQSDIGQIQLLITDGIKPVVKEINGMKKDMVGMKKDIFGVKREIDGVKDEIKDVKDSLRLIPTKEEFFNSMDELMGEVKKVREEQEVIGGTLSEHSDRLGKIEEKVGITSSY